MKKLYHTVIATAFLGLAISASNVASASDNRLYFGIVPQQAASRLAKMWGPFMNEISNQTGMTIQFATMKDIPSFEKCLAKGAYDISYMNPYHYTVFSKQSGYEAIAHQTEKKLKGLIVVRSDSDVLTLKDLRGQKVAFPSPAAFGASVLPRAEMQGQNIDFEPIYVKSHDSVYKAVANKLMPAGGGVQRTFNSIPDDLKDQLKVIYRTNGYTPHAFAVKGDMDEKRKQAIQAAMILISQEHPELLKNIGMKGIQNATNDTWNDVRDLELSMADTKIEQQGEVKCRFD
ncbi:phosphate/phosphite/phosphonate ABC transporter substrate-binding protein [Curvivirga sp.]|uniref:phosphate/phosphite/phosphonate ABC transporter substrate-binding protein n=1 Tax=Curvivirga sp. TaxID=2856848 RepID=UPI003B5CD5D6